MSEALAAIFPATTLQTCIIHLLRHSLDYASWKERKALAAALRPIYTAPSADAAGAALDTFERGPWGLRYLRCLRGDNLRFLCPLRSLHHLGAPALHCA